MSEQTRFTWMNFVRRPLWVFLLAFVVFCPPVLSQVVYQWTDGTGISHFSDRRPISSNSKTEVMGSVGTQTDVEVMRMPTEINVIRSVPALAEQASERPTEGAGAFLVDGSSGADGISPYDGATRLGKDGAVGAPGKVATGSMTGTVTATPSASGDLRGEELSINAQDVVDARTSVERLERSGSESSAILEDARVDYEDVGEAVPAADYALEAETFESMAIVEEEHPRDTLRALADALGIQIGASIHGIKWAQDERYREVLAKEFNAATVFTFMSVLQPKPGIFNKKPLGRQVAFAEEHDLELIGQAFVYRRDTLPRWLQSRDVVERELDWILREHIRSTIRAGGPRFKVWHVVNEPLTNRNQPWEGVFGRDGYISRAFRYARAAAPEAVLVLNETFGRDGVDERKRVEFFELVERLRGQGVPIDGVGIELHLERHRLRASYLTELQDFFRAAEAAGVATYITEMDVYQGPPGSLSPSGLTQEEVFGRTLELALEQPSFKGFHVWGVSDKYSWLRTRNRLRYEDAAPLLFDDEFRRKPAYYAVQAALRKALEKR